MQVSIWWWSVSFWVHRELQDRAREVPGPMTRAPAPSRKLPGLQAPGAPGPASPRASGQGPSTSRGNNENEERRDRKGRKPTNRFIWFVVLIFVLGKQQKRKPTGPRGPGATCAAGRARSRGHPGPDPGPWHTLPHPGPKVCTTRKCSYSMLCTSASGP